MTLNFQIRRFIFFSMFLAVLDSCYHKETTMPITNNPEIAGYKEEWEPDTNEPWWKVSIYEALKNCAEEYNN